MAQQEEDQQEIFMVDERKEKMVTPLGENPTVRTARFLKPSVTCINQVAEIPLFDLNELGKWSSQVQFKGWRCPQFKWKEWVDQMSPKYESIWKKAGIYDSIIVSTYSFRKDTEYVLGLTEFWCPETNTFVFPWGEATLTLEDMYVLGGFSVIGEPLTNPLIEDLSAIEQKLIEEHNKVSKSTRAKPSHLAWMKHFMDSNSELEHVGFLSLWLSRYVLPTYPEEIMSKKLFPIAIHLSRATRVALAPAVLASIYRDLRVLKQHIFSSITASSSGCNELHLSVWAPFQVMLLWAWEHLPTLRPNPNFLNHGDPRAAWWLKIRKNIYKLKLESLRSIMNSIENFKLRPYADIVDNWRRPSFYEEEGRWISNSPNINDELQSFCCCIMACELVGLDCIEQYLPHRVGMQFGMDQDLPGHFVCANATWEVAGRTYDKPNRNVRFYIPPCVVEPNVTERYFEWKQHGLARQDTSQNILEQKQSSKRLKKSQDTSDGNELECQVAPPPGFPRKCWWELQSSSDHDNMTLLKRFNQFEDSNTSKNRGDSTHKPSSSTQVQCPSSTTEREIAVKKMVVDPTENNVHNKVSMDSDNNSLDTLVDKGESNMDEIPVPGMELEARINTLEKAVAELKFLFGSMVAMKLSNEGLSH